MFFSFVYGFKNLHLKFLWLDKTFVSVLVCSFNPLSANPIKWLNTLKQFVGKLPTNCLSVLGHFVNLALKGLISNKGREFDKARRDVCSICFVYSYKIHNGVLTKKTALTKLLENTLNESSKIKKMMKDWDIRRNHS